MQDTTAMFLHKQTPMKLDVNLQFYKFCNVAQFGTPQSMC